RLEIMEGRHVASDAQYWLQLRLIDPLRIVESVGVYFRRSRSKYLSVATRGDHQPIVAGVPELRMPANSKLEFYPAAVDRWGGQLFLVGSPNQPLPLGSQ